jgi:hypothetical protein
VIYILCGSEKQRMMEKKNLKAMDWMLALAVCIGPAACDRLGGGLEHREKVAVNLSFGGLEPWGAETVVRGASEAPVETASVALEGNWVLEVAWTEEPAPPTRANLNDGAILRVVAIDGSGIVDEKDYVCQSDGSLEPGTGGPVMVEPGSYQLMAYSYNATAPATPTPTSSGTMVAVSPYVDGTANNDLIATEVPVAITVSDGSSGPSLNLVHRFSRMKYSENIPSGAPVVINSVSLTNSYTATLNKTTGALPKVAAAAQLLDESTPRMVYTQGAAPELSVSGTIGGTPFTKLVLYTTELEGGKSYTLHINVKQGGRAWAGSNIYWDGSKLTFKEVNYAGDENYYQGVYFQWGSLVGTSPVGSSFSVGTNGSTDGTTIYVYHNNQWEETNVATAYAGLYSGFTASAWTGIPYATFVGNQDNYNTDILGDHYPFQDGDGNDIDTGNAGDICRFIGLHGGPPGYRMPKAMEFTPGIRLPYYWDSSATRTAASIGWNISNFPTSEISSNDAAGRQMFGPSSSVSGAYATNYNVVFPMAGRRYHDGKSLHSVGLEGRYWGSPFTVSMNFNDDEVYTGTGYHQKFGFSVRCLLDN